MKRRILFVEDTPMSIAVVRKEIEHLGYKCEVATDGEQAIKKAAEYLPVLIVMDISLPKMDGLQATAEIRRNPRTRAIPILAATARAMPGDRERCKEAGFDDYLSKPFGHKELGARIENLLKKSGKPSQNNAMVASGHP